MYVNFWLTQQGPRFDGDPRRANQRCIGEVVCPACGNVLARLYDAAGGIEVLCWVPAHGAVPGDQDNQRAGWLLYTFLDGDSAEATCPLPCWRGHHGFAISTSLCREIVNAYRSRGKRTRRPAAPIEGAVTGEG